jgi:hypothetical protein
MEIRHVNAEARLRAERIRGAVIIAFVALVAIVARVAAF